MDLPNFGTHCKTHFAVTAFLLEYVWTSLRGTQGAEKITTGRSSCRLYSFVRRSDTMKWAQCNRLDRQTDKQSEQLQLHTWKLGFGQDSLSYFKRFYKDRQCDPAMYTRKHHNMNSNWIQVIFPTRGAGQVNAQILYNMNFQRQLQKQFAL